MSLAGFKKQINKANQYMSEKIGGAKGTELDDDFMDMERKVDTTGRLVEELMARTHEYLQPNPAARAKMTTFNTVSKIRGQAKNALYPQPEGTLGECMVKYGRELGEETPYGSALVETGEGYRQMADIKYALEDNVKQNFIEPLHHLQTKDIKEVNHHRKKLQGRRLDFDCKKRKQTRGATGSTVTEAEIQMAEEKFDESKQLAEAAMFNLLENDTEQISQMSAFIEAQLEYHRQATDILANIYEVLQQKANDAQSRPRKELVPRRVNTSYDKSPTTPYGQDISDSAGYTSNNTFNNSSSSNAKSKPCAEALYDFDPENEGELGFKEGDIIDLKTRIDENWLEGSVHGNTGFFPCNYVKVIVPLP